MSSLFEALQKVGKVSCEQAKLEEDRRRDRDAGVLHAQLEAIKSRRIEALLNQVRRVTTLKRFRPVARDLLLLQPDSIGIVVESAGALQPQDGLEKFREDMTRLYEWLPSLSEDEQESLIKEAFK
ncbi:hypothetical protein A3D62_00560 [Candidatus Kaiserbacteria bacterium RIFCSPHIGHO2_02_FULL_49_11]|uniref:Uncharacterized protein n=1 Tax=Candidatus Kaiserbacteria bacterium RIFCSPHIGHO2_02_FULL_49_11 TaxID=1798489 RepID=A0A1F6CZ06_9BACT|nr:MAG: hypothetical protein A3D62_00560 [Candidatus Kaiserbacteria bacterium RIFCSPHIGHO2_02_FULL_49_11]